ncbi:MAG: hypothetical protein MUC77_09045 [Chromatiaceae bacterium]|nr:hypothetical protein [Chromatiaceae bacterium]
MPVPLTAVSIQPVPITPSEREQALIAAAARRGQDLLARNPGVTTLLGSDVFAFCAGLRALRQLDLPAGPRFCDWGSGIGTMTALAALNGLDAYGIEIEPAFVTAARALCAELAVPARFACGSFLSSDLAGRFAVTGTYGATHWAVPPPPDAYSLLGARISEMDLIYAYPWPREVALYERLFELTARRGAALWLYRQGEPPRVLVKE